MLDSIPLGLRHSVESGNCVLFVGAGIGHYVTGPDGKPGPDAVTLARELADYFNVPILVKIDLRRRSVQSYAEISLLHSMNLVLLLP